MRVCYIIIPEYEIHLFDAALTRRDWECTDRRVNKIRNNMSVDVKINLQSFAETCKAHSTELSSTHRDWYSSRAFS